MCIKTFTFSGEWTKTKDDSQFVRSKDLTEDMVPKDIENERLMAKVGILIVLL